MIKSLKVPDDRIGVLIGRSGKVRKYLERKTNTKILIGDEVQIEGEALDVMVAENVIKAVSRGFSPNNAYALLDEENLMSLMDLPKDHKKLMRIRSRLIGSRGKCRRTLELLTETKISIYGRTVAIIGNYENIQLAEDGINRLMKGITHNKVYAYLEGQRSKITHTEEKDENF